MNKKTLVYSLALLVVAGSVGAISASAHGFGFGGGQLFTQAEVETRITEKVADGTLTQEQADRFLERMDQMEEKRAEMEARHEEHKAEVAEFLGLSVEEFETQVQSGLRIDEIAEAQGVSEEEFKAFHQSMMLEHISEELAEKVAAGELTQEEADEKLTQIEAGEFPGKLMGRGHHGPRGMGEGNGFGF